MESSTGAFFDRIPMPRTPSDRAEVYMGLVCVRGGVWVCVCVCVCVEEYEDIYVHTRMVCVCACVHIYPHPPKNGKIALLLTTNGLMCSKHVSQTQNEAIDNCQRYKMLLNFIW